MRHASLLHELTIPWWNFLLKDAVRISRYLPYGSGVSQASEGVGRNLSDLDSFIRASETAHCGNYALMFVNSLPWFVGWTVYDLTTTDGRVHSVVEVEVLSKRIVYDPTLGVEYQCSLESMINGHCDYEASPSYYFAHPALQEFRGAGFFYGATVKRMYKRDSELISLYFSH